MKVMLISNDYLNSTIYPNLHKHLMTNEINSMMIVPSNKNANNIIDEKSVIQLKCFNHIDRYFFHFKQNKILKELKKQVENNRPDVLHSQFLFSGGYVSMKIKKEFNIPYVVTVQNTDVNVFLKKMIHLRKIGVEVMMNADKIIFISKAYREQVKNKYVPQKYHDKFLEKSIIIPFGADRFWLENSYKAKKLSPRNNIHLITVGVINQNKNHLTVAKAAEELIKRGYNVEYTVIGSVKDVKVFKELSKYGFVNYIEKVPKEELINYYRKSDILVLPSISESFGLVYVEAISQGLPIIYTRGQGFDKQFNEGIVGFSVNCFDVQDISNKIINIVDNYIEISNKCVISCNKFDWDNIVKNYVEIYAHTIDGY